MSGRRLWLWVLAGASLSAAKIMKMFIIGPTAGSTGAQEAVFLFCVPERNFSLGDPENPGFQKVFEKNKIFSRKIKNIDSDEKLKIAKKSKTAVRSCKFLAREARRKFWNVNLHYSKKRKSSLYTA